MAANEQRPSPPPAPPSGERRGTRLSHSNRRVGKESVASARSIQATRARPPRPVRVASPPAPATLSSPSPALGPCACRVSLAAARDAPTSAFAARACTSRRLAPRDRHLNKTHLARKISLSRSLFHTDLLGSVFHAACGIVNPLPSVWNNPTRSRDGASSSDDNSDTGPDTHR